MLDVSTKTLRTLAAAGVIEPVRLVPRANLRWRTADLAALAGRDFDSNQTLEARP